MMPRRVRGLALLTVAFCTQVPVRADPWLPPGDEGIRHDIQLLADSDILHGPVTTWPISWPDIARDVLGVSAHDSDLDDATLAALLRIQRLARTASARGFSGARTRISVARKPIEIRSFADTPREEGEAALGASWLGDHGALNLQAAVVADADDARTLRPDGSYLGFNVGNFMLSAGFAERWWGPGWDGSLILSSNARPIPSLSIERNYSDPWRIRPLSWFGPWRASIAVGEMESHDVAVPKARFLAARVNFKPWPWLEIGLSRTAQWCGGGRPCGWGTLRDLLIGRDNRDETLLIEDEPGNQMAGYDARLRSPWRALPIVFYTQWIGEDEAGGLPSKFLGLFGLETWGSTRFGGFRLRAEYADTTCMFTREMPAFNCAYRNTLYPQGYTYRHRVIGHSMDNDSRMFSLGGIVTRHGGSVLSVNLRRTELNRDGGPHSISPVPFNFHTVELRYSQTFSLGRISLGGGYADHRGPTDAGADAHGYLTWEQGF